MPILIVSALKLAGDRTCCTEMRHVLQSSTWSATVKAGGSMISGWCANDSEYTPEAR